MPTEEKIRVIIVDDIAETRENLKRLLQFDLNIEVVGAARGGQEALELCRQINPDVVIMDINMPDMDGITATELIRRDNPATQVVILSVQNEASYMRKAMLAGARDFLAKPPSVDELTKAIHQAGRLAQAEYKKVAASAASAAHGGGQEAPTALVHGKIIVVYSPKGGVGTTTIATNLSLALQSETEKTVLVDGSLQFGDVAVFLNEQVKHSILDLTPRVEELDRDIIDSVTIQHSNTGLRIVAAPPRPEMAEKVMADQFAKLLQYLRNIYSFVVVDTTSYLTDIVQSAIEIADVIVLITTQEIPAIKNANAFLNLTDGSEISRERIMFVMNRYDKRIAITPEQIGKSLRQEIAIAVPVDERLVTNAINRGIPFVLENKVHPTSKSIYGMAELLRQKISQLEGEAPPAGR